MARNSSMPRVGLRQKQLLLLTARARRTMTARLPHLRGGFTLRSCAISTPMPGIPAIGPGPSRLRVCAADQHVRGLRHCPSSLAEAHKPSPCHRLAVALPRQQPASIGIACVRGGGLHMETTDLLLMRTRDGYQHPAGLRVRLTCVANLGIAPSICLMQRTAEHRLVHSRSAPPAGK